MRFWCITGNRAMCPGTRHRDSVSQKQSVLLISCFDLLFYPVPDNWLTPGAIHVMAVNSTRECICLRTASRYRHQRKEKSQRKLRQEDCLEPKVRLCYIVCSRPVSYKNLRANETEADLV